MPRLRRSDWRQPGFTRRRSGRGFSYLGLDGKRLTAAAALERAKQLAIPPAWTEVWICDDELGHLQAVGIDDAGRRQYLYHARWRSQRDAKKHQLARQLGQHLPSLRRTTRAAVRLSGLPEQRVLACAVRMLDLGLFRVGGERYAELNDSFGLATLRRDHVSVTSHAVQFSYPAKSGQEQTFALTDPSIIDVISQLLARDDPSPELLAWKDTDQDSWVDLRSEHVNTFLKTKTSSEVTAKDFRTWHGSVLMAMELHDAVEGGEALSKRRLTEAYRTVASELGNTVTVARNSYVDPEVVELAQQGRTIGHHRRQRHELVPTAASTALIRLLEES